MKKTFFILALSTLSLAASAQVKFGIKAGGLLSNFAYRGVGLSSSDGQPDTKLSYLLGTAVAFPIGDHLSLQTELLYSKKGARTGFISALGETSRTRDQLHYLSVAPLLRYRVVDRLDVGVGPEVSYLIGSYERTELLGSRPTLMPYRSLDLAVNFDAQYHLLERWSVGLRYNLGVYDVTDRFEIVSFDDEVFVIDGDVYNRSVQLSLYYWLR